MRQLETHTRRYRVIVSLAHMSLKVIAYISTELITHPWINGNICNQGHENPCLSVTSRHHGVVGGPWVLKCILFYFLMIDQITSLSAALI